MGEIKGPEYYRQLYGVDAVHYADEILQVLTDLKPPALHVLHGKNTDRCDRLAIKTDSKVHAWTIMLPIYCAASASIKQFHGLQEQ